MDKKKFYCQSCDYGCDNNSTYNKHLKSQVHARGGQKKYINVNIVIIPQK